MATLSTNLSTALHERDLAVAQRDAALAEHEKLLLILSQYRRALFGRRSERQDQGQLELMLAATAAAPVAANENTPATSDKAAAGTASAQRQPRRNRGRLPLELPRIEVVIDIEDKTCPCCGGTLHKIGESVKEMFDVVPVQYRVKRIIRPRWGCRACEGAVVQAPAPPQAIDGVMASEAMLVNVAILKYAYHVPLYRQEQMLAAHGIDLDRQTLASWMGRLAWWLKPLHEELLATVLSYPKLFADETPLPVLDPGRGRTRTCRFWAVATDDRPWAGPAPPAVVYVFAEDRRGIRATELFAGFHGVLQVDGYAGYNSLADPARAGGPVTLAFCFAHARRKFYEVNVATGSPIAAEALQRIGVFYAVEANIRGATADERRRLRQAETKPLVEAFKLWLEARLAEISKKSGLAQAIRYTLAHWEGLTRFLDDGRIEIDNNVVERSIKPVALGRKNSLFAGSIQGAQTWAILASLINSAKLNDVEPQAWLTDALERIVSGRTTINRLHELLPWIWEAARTERITFAA
ncbi:IS66 family transposase [Rhodoplanes sp. SY1]|uniref:IS66 family transposase n=1 Tax=Rhodoplanes sp. SY1 TaxID=3166646 RepID=UPI0038B69FF2